MTFGKRFWRSISWLVIFATLRLGARFIFGLRLIRNTPEQANSIDRMADEAVARNFELRLSASLAKPVDWSLEEEKKTVRG